MTRQTKAVFYDIHITLKFKCTFKPQVTATKSVIIPTPYVADLIYYVFI